jgi:MoaA/NifB/PqqE/SkfB family radical SAM enzyme
MPLTHAPTTILQINIGLYCNQACVHCHVESSPLRTEAMSASTIDEVLSRPSLPYRERIGDGWYTLST